MDEAIVKVDQAALALLQALDAYEAEMTSCLAAQDLKRLRAEVVNLRRSLLGLEMGVLYHDWAGDAARPEGKAIDVCGDVFGPEKADPLAKIGD